MTIRDTCEHACELESGGCYCDTYYPDACPYPARFCRVKDRRDEAASLDQPKDTIWEALSKGFS